MITKIIPTIASVVSIYLLPSLSCVHPLKVVIYTTGKLPRDDINENFVAVCLDIIPDLIITDVMMPYVDGFEMVNKLRRNEITSHIPVIMLTAKADIGSRIEGIRQGADVYLEKQFNKEELLLRIKKLLEMRKNLQQYYLRKAGITEGKPATAATEEICDTEIENVFVKKVREAIEQNITKVNFTVEKLSKIVFLSHSQLHRKLEALTGCSPNQFIRMVRLKKAKSYYGTRPTA